jgi:hypothetical protein
MLPSSTVARRRRRRNDALNTMVGAIVMLLTMSTGCAQLDLNCLNPTARNAKSSRYVSAPPLVGAGYCETHWRTLTTTDYLVSGEQVVEWPQSFENIPVESNHGEPEPQSVETLPSPPLQIIETEISPEADNESGVESDVMLPQEPEMRKIDIPAPTTISLYFHARPIEQLIHTPRRLV